MTVIIARTRISVTGGIGIDAYAATLILDTPIIAAATPIRINYGATVQISGSAFDTTAVSGTYESLAGDRAVLDALTYATRHANDTDNSVGIHHTLAGIVTGISADRNMILASQIFGG